MTTSKPNLFTASFFAASGANFLLFFTFYMILPVLPIYLHSQFHASRSTIGLVLSSYTVMALLFRPFAGFIVDSVPRKPLLLIVYLLCISFFGWYMLAGSLIFFAILRATHGIAFGAVSVSNNTMAIDIMPSERRGEGIGYFGVTSNLAMAVGPTLSLYLLDAYNDFNLVFGVALSAGIIGFLMITLIKPPLKAKENIQKTLKEPISFDRFLLIKAITVALVLTLLSFSYGVMSSYIALYGKEEVGLHYGTGRFFIFLSLGLIISRIPTAKLVNQQRYKGLITSGIIGLIIGYAVLVFCKTSFGYFAAASIVGISYGLINPSFQSMIIGMGRTNQRGTANATYYTAWDLGIGAGTVAGGVIAGISNYSSAFLTGIIFAILGLVWFRIYFKPKNVNNNSNI